MNSRMSGLVVFLSVGYIALVCCAANAEDLNLDPSEDVSIRDYLQRIYENRPHVPSLQTSELFAKRAHVLPYSGGIYGKRAAVPFSGGIYGKRSRPNSMSDLLDQGIPMNGGFFG